MEAVTASGRVAALAVSERKGTVKLAVPRAVFVADHGIAGDAHAGPGDRQVSILAVESIRVMEEALGRPLDPGRFGENVVVEGCGLAAVRVGDRIALGDAELEVAAIGKTCHHGCEIRRLTGDCIMPREGVFARVLAGAEVRVGAGVRLLPGGGTE
ncbi:MAG: MOSC domain-containing protein [Deltaproteobacteria bacterium]|nr:MOSC domain-containing protein [Deltaproteobacteria bacterium]